jgi:hypothetical protein
LFCFADIFNYPKDINSLWHILNTLYIDIQFHKWQWWQWNLFWKMFREATTLKTSLHYAH